MVRFVLDGLESTWVFWVRVTFFRCVWGCRCCYVKGYLDWREYMLDVVADR